MVFVMRKTNLRRLLVLNKLEAIKSRDGIKLSLVVELGDRGGPDGEDERSLVDEIGNVVDEIEDRGRHGAGEETEEIARGVDAPADGNDAAHGVEGVLHGLGSVGGGLHLAGFAVENLVQDVEPAGKSADEASPGVDGSRLAHVTEQKHDDGADEEAPEDATGAGTDGSEDEVEFDHLKGHGDAPIDVTVDGGRPVVGDPEFTHVEVVDGGNEGDEGTSRQGHSPVAVQSHSFPQEEHC